MCSLGKNKLTHLISGASEINQFIFWTPPPLFSRVTDAQFLGAPSQDGFFSTIVLRFGCVLEETHGTTYLEVVREVLKEGRNLRLM